MDQEIEKLRKELKEAREAYYNLNPKITDQEYDAKVDRLRQLCPGDFEVTTVGASPPTHSIWEKVQHEIPMGSLAKVNEESEFLEWAGKLPQPKYPGNYPELLITYKLDGSSLEVIYEKGELIRGTTRGDGRIGEDITENIIKIPNLPKTIPITKERVHVRGEVMMLKKVFETKYSNQYANPRNTAAGKVRDKKNRGGDCENLIFVAFTLVSKTAPNTESDRFIVLEKMKFATPPHYLSNDPADIIKWHKVVTDDRDNIPYEIDGTVIRINNIPEQEALGELNQRPRGQIAWKFDPAMGTTIIKDIKWQVGPTGRITGVAVLEPVHIGGVTITHVSLHNIKMFNQLQLWPGCEVLVSRRNDVIPYIESNLSL